MSSSSAAREFAGLPLLETLGEGRRSTVYLVEREGRPAALKIYKPEASEKIRRKLGREIAEFEYARNRELYEVDGLERYVAEPLGIVHDGGRSALLQERVPGELYFFYVRRHPGCDRARLRERIDFIAETAHAAGYYDIDLHSLNVMVTDDEGEPVPKLVDFNLVPFFLDPSSPLPRLALRLGLIDRAWRDRRRLRVFDDVHEGHVKILRGMGSDG